MGKRAAYLVCGSITVVLGLASRRYGDHLPSFLADYAGDTLWALLVFLGIGFLFPNARLGYRAGAALVFSYLVEVSQLYHAPWIEAIRATTLGGLVLGSGFLWSDLLCYMVGIVAGAAMEARNQSIVFRNSAMFDSEEVDDTVRGDKE